LALAVENAPIYPAYPAGLSVFARVLPLAAVEGVLRREDGQRLQYRLPFFRRQRIPPAPAYRFFCGAAKEAQVGRVGIGYGSIGPKAADQLRLLLHHSAVLLLLLPEAIQQSLLVSGRLLPSFGQGLHLLDGAGIHRGQGWDPTVHKLLGYLGKAAQRAREGFVQEDPNSQKAQ
jgi:hypothetical protein